MAVCDETPGDPGAYPNMDVLKTQDWLLRRDTKEPSLAEGELDTSNPET